MQNKSPQAVIFDMDGVLIDSEPFWQQAEVEVFGSVGVPLTLEMCHRTTGLRMDAVVDYWFERFPWSVKSKRDVEDAVNMRVKNLILEQAIAKSGAVELVKELAARPIRLAVCSSSAQSIIEAVCAKLAIKSHF